MSCLQIYMNTGVHMFISMVERSQCSFHSTISMGVMKHPLWSNRTPLGELDFHTSYSTQKGFIKHPTFNSDIYQGPDHKKGNKFRGFNTVP